MPADRFFDTNILIYSIVPSDPRSAQARKLLASGGTISVQVLNEFVNVARKKMKLDWPRVEASLRSFATLLEPPVDVTLDQHRAALTIARIYGFTIFDAAIIASAIASGCRTLCTEDLQHGQRIAGIRIINPFLPL